MAGAILAHTAFKMIFEDGLISSHVPHLVIVTVPWIIALAILTYGLYSIRKVPAQAEVSATEEE
jgi:Na+-transporting NADH:ubiquinone oxidoreductase subunit NqrB